MLSPLAPAFGEECWEAIHDTSSSSEQDIQLLHHSVFTEPWPVHDDNALKEDKVVCGVQVNGKGRFTVEFEVSELPKDKAVQEQFLRDLIYQHERAAKWLKDDQGVAKQVKKMIVVKGGKNVNFVI